ncbi:MAG: HAD-IIA family hydrolase [Fimbriimonadaceae bacterium]
MRAYPLYIFDLDGTLFRGEEPTPHAVQTLCELRNQGATIRFLTNNSSKTIQFLTDKLQRLGFEAAPEEVMNSAVGTARYLKGKVESAFVIGESGLLEALTAVGISQNEVNPGAVVVGFDRQFSFDVLAQGMAHLRNQECLFVASNPDRSYPLENDVLIPGAGSIVAALETCSSRKATVIGKPNPLLIQMILDDAGVAAQDCLAVGDRPETDIEAGIAAGCDTHLVLCGVTKEAPVGQNYSADLSALLEVSAT